MYEKAKNIWTRSLRKTPFGECECFRKQSDPTSKQKCERRPQSVVVRAWGGLIRIPRVFLILLAGFSANFAQSGPISGHFSLSGCQSAIFHVGQVSLFFVHQRYTIHYIRYTVDDIPYVDEKVKLLQYEKLHRDTQEQNNGPKSAQIGRNWTRTRPEG